MRKNTRKCVNAFLNAKELMPHSSPDNIMVEGSRVIWRLYQTNIAVMDLEKHEITISTGGYNTAMTKERLNALPSVRLNTKAFQMYLNGNEWNGEPVTIPMP